MDPVSAVLARDITAWKQRHDGMLLERSHELARIESALLEARLGTGTFLVVEGPAGIGKTAVLAAAEAAAGDEGMHVLRARAAELERDFAFGVVRQLFEPLLAESSERQRAELLQGGAGQAASLLGLPGAPAEEARHATADGSSFAILHGLYWLCAHLANDAPLCVVVDDAHWADASSLRFLAFLLTRVRELDIALVLAARSEEPGTDRELLVRLKADPSAEVIRLPPLTRHAVARVVTVKLGEP